MQNAIRELEHATGIVIPVYLPKDIATAQAADLVRDTTAACCRQVVDPALICLSVDGAASGGDTAAAIAKQFGVTCRISPDNHGKFHAAREGVSVLLENPSLRHIAVIDQDGDHFPHELLNFVTAARSVQRQAETQSVLVLGRRLSRHRPMGFLRGELEELADRVLLDALNYRAVIKRRPLPLQYAFAFDEFPDFHSGYKLFSRACATAVFGSAPELCGVDDDCYYRHACEAVMTVEAIEHGAYLAVVNRTTLNEQPISTFGLLNRSRLVADKMVWPCRRLEIPRAFAAQWLDNHIPRLLLNTLTPDGKGELEEIRRFVLDAYAQAPGPPRVAPDFV